MPKTKGYSHMRKHRNRNTIFSTNYFSGIQFLRYYRSNLDDFSPPGPKNLIVDNTFTPAINSADTILEDFYFDHGNLTEAWMFMNWVICSHGISHNGDIQRRTFFTLQTL